jgi:hypothetical protein
VREVRLHRQRLEHATPLLAPDTNLVDEIPDDLSPAGLIAVAARTRARTKKRHGAVCSASIALRPSAGEV